jgi:transposase
MYSGAGCRTSVFVSIFAVRFKHRPPTPTDCVQVLRWSWGIEVYHRALKQCCGVERAQVRCRRAVWGHLLLALRAFVRLEVYRLRCGVIPIAEPEFINEVYLHPTSHIGGTPMSGRKLTVDWKHTAEELYAHYNNTPNTQIARRFQALALLRRGRTLKETAAIVGVSIRTVQKWLTWYRTGELDELTRRTRGGNRIPVRPLLTPDQQARLIQHAATQGFRTLREAAAWCRETLGVELSERQVQRLFHRLGVRRKIPRPMAVRADAALQAQWKKGGFARR